MNKGNRKRGRPTSQTEIDLSKVYQVALDSFAEKGFDGTSTTDIAKKAGIARSLLHYYFGNKDALWVKTMERLHKDLVKEFDRYKSTYSDKSGIEWLKAIIRSEIRYFSKYPQYSRIIAHELSNPSERADWIIEHLINPFYTLTADTFKEERNLGRIKKLAKENQSTILLGMSSYFFSYAYLIRKKFGKDPFDEAEIEKHADTVVEIFFHGIVKP